MSEANATNATKTAKSVIHLNPADNVAILVRGGGRGDVVIPGERRVTLSQDVPGGHKIAVSAIPKGAPVVKYGHVIGAATHDIAPGDHVHEHNVATRLGATPEFPEWNAKAFLSSPPRLDAAPVAGTFNGYRRSSGRPGVRNDLWVIPTVGCVNGELRALIRDWEKDWKKPAWIDDVKVLEHPFGCSQLGGDLAMTADLLAGLARHPNAAGVLIAGLGCENLQLSMLLERLGASSRVRSLVLQDEDEEALIPMLNELADAAPRAREPFPASELCVGVKCGGSDGYSGLTANPLAGRFSDRLVASGGTVIATEIPEMFGAEEVIVERIADKAVYDDFVALDRWFRDYFVRYGRPVYENPSPGNRAGGITTLEEKSLGAVEKSGNGRVTRVLKYGQPALPGGGVQIAFAPGNDLVSCTALAAAGAQIVLYTTGRGTPFGTVVPSLKISSNSDLARRRPGWIDFDAGTLLSENGDGGETFESATDRLVELVLRVAGGERVACERRGGGEIAIFRDGVTL
ncbi:MAG: altronate dehydratase family protein [Synergistaceae bacterium]|jgi:altronate hydrolase|nr:altronate dehydratase family protein [Synergistaceae bacterium]